jgi:UDP-N-acetylmuramoyl-L-alanyl-D-glutamate--2,6-diaminopimelate ligase
MVAPLQLPCAADAATWLRQRGARSLASDSRRVRPGDAFIAWPGHVHDARRFVPAALAGGALACLVAAEGVAAFGFADERVAALRGLKAAAGAVASDFLGAPSRRLDVLAVTGTNGKTSTAWWLAQALSALGRRCGVVGTLGIGEPPDVQASGLTTPDPVELQLAFHRFAEERFAACAIEASSIGLAEQRLAGSAIKVALYTNLTRDHLDHHGTMDAYWQAKSTLFDWPGLQAAVVNIDDDQGAVLAGNLAQRPLDLWTFSVGRPARLSAQGLAYRDGGLCFDVREGGASLTARSALVGDYNVANLLAVIGGLRALGVPLADAVAACARLTPVPGRMQRVAPAAPMRDAPEVVIDYAHTPDALEKALTALRPFAHERGGRLWCVFGCGGNRDASKRPLMGAIAERLADHVIVTSDNPRDEAPNFIISQILVGVIGHDDVDVIEDRRAAIVYAVQSADARDVLLIAGKGHEVSQEIAGVKHPFSDVAVAQSLLVARAKRGAA